MTFEKQLEVRFPQWMEQTIQVMRKEKKWQDFTIEQRTCKGWLKPYLVDLDAKFNLRWDYWSLAMFTGKVPDTPIPRLYIFDHQNSDAMANLEKCLTGTFRYGVRLNDFFDWLLWGFGSGDKKPDISDKANEYLCRTFDLGLLLKFPHDYLGTLMSEAKQGRWNNPNSFYPTPHEVCRAMIEMEIADEENIESMKTKSVADFCGGTARTLMFASNYSVNLHYADNDPMCCKAALINAYLYIPWMVYPLKEFNR